MDLVRYPDPGLRSRCRRIERDELGDSLRRTARKMFEIMYRCRGIGLAAPQAGLSIRLVVANLTGDPAQRDQEEVYVSPEILSRHGERKEEEACLSLPGLYAEIARSETVTFRYMDLQGTVHEKTVSGLHARMIQHEVDHLDGFLICDRMTPADQARWAAHLKALEREYAAEPRGKTAVTGR